MFNRQFVVVGGGCGFLGILIAVILCALFLLPLGFITNLRGNLFQEQPRQEPAAPERDPDALSTQQAIPTLPAGEGELDSTPSANEFADAGTDLSVFPDQARLAQAGNLLSQLYSELNPGVVNIQVAVEQDFGGQGMGAGSGFILDEQGHIVTNNHVVAAATDVIVVFYDGSEALAEIVGTDDDSDLAVIRVDRLPEGVRPLPLGESGDVQTGEWVIAIGNPFSLGGTMTLGIVSSVGRVIPSGVTPFSIPEAIQTDAAINPGNSGGPLLNLDGEVIGVNAQIRTDPGVRANAGVGFAIPSNVVRRVVPVLIEQGSYQWPWLGVRGGSLNLTIAEELNLDTQRGAFIVEATPGGPADEAGLQNEDVIVQANGEPLENYEELLTLVAFSNPGDQMALTVIRGGERVEVTVTLGARPDNFNDFGVPQQVP